MSDEQHKEPSSETARDIAAFESRYKRAAERIRAEEDPEQALEDAAHLANALRGIANEAAELRTWAVRPVWDKERMPLSRLAERIGVSKARADQITRTFRTNPSQEGGE